MNTQLAPVNNLQLTRNLYNKYAGKLLGYIFQVVKDEKLAEEYLAAVFSEISQYPVGLFNPDINTYLQLQLITRKVLADFYATIPQCAGWEQQREHFPVGSNKFLLLMSDEEQQVFCMVHYHGKKISEVAAEMNKPETEIRHILQKAFTVIRKGQI